MWKELDQSFCCRSANVVEFVFDNDPAIGLKKIRKK